MPRKSNWVRTVEQGPPAILRDRLLAQARVMRTRPRQIVIAHGALSNEVYLVLNGTFEVLITARDGQDVVLRDLGPGAIFGDLAALDRQPRSATVTSTSAGSIAAVPAADFLIAVSEMPEANRWFMNRLAEEVRRLTDKTFELSALSARGRLHCELLRLAAAAPESGRIEPAPTHEAFAQRIGSQRELVSRELSRLEKAGILTRGLGSIDIDTDRLTQLVEIELGYPIAQPGHPA